MNESFLIAGGYKLMVVESTFSHDTLRSSKPGTGMHKVYFTLMDGNEAAFFNLNGPETICDIIHKSSR